MTDIDAEPTDEEDDQPAQVEAEPVPAEEGRGRGPVRAVAALAVVFFLGAVGLAVLSARLSSQLQEERGDRREVERVSSRFGQSLLTFDYRNMTPTRDAVFSLSTGTFHKQYEQAFKSLTTLIQQGKTVSRGTVTDVFVGDIGDHNASVIVVVDTATTGTAGPRSAVDSYIQLDLVQTGGRWLVDGVTNLNFNQAVGGPAPSAAPSTTAPTPPG